MDFHLFAVRITFEWRRHRRDKAAVRKEGTLGVTNSAASCLTCAGADEMIWVKGHRRGCDVEIA